jgi:two-component system, chemotaxis family, protein-glutamate methylesterase/glutaminase
MIKVLIVEDSVVVRDFLVHILGSDSEIHVVGTARDGLEAIEMVKKKQPDVITMDIEMPRMNGLDATRKIMHSYPTPIVIVTASYERQEVEKTFTAIEAGALAILPKPTGFFHDNHVQDKTELIKTVKLMAGVKVITRRLKARSLVKVTHKPLVKRDLVTKRKIIAIGVSTGGPQILNTIFSKLSENIKIPIMVVQHIPPGFLEGMVDWLNKSSKLPVRIARHNETILPGNIYFAPDKLQMGVCKNGKVLLSKDKAYFGLIPSVSFLFRSIAKKYDDKAIGILLSGMGKDGSEELNRMHEKGALTIIQDKSSSVVYGMPGEALKLGGVDLILSPESIVAKINEIGASE